MWKELFEWREKVLKRDGHKCVQCGSAKKLEADHIKSFIAYPSLRLEVSNGRTLCNPCHKKTLNYGVGARKEQAIVACMDDPLNRERWIDLGKAMGWKEPSKNCLACDGLCEECVNGNCWYCEDKITSQDIEKNRNQGWLYHWHRLIDHLAERKNIEQFFAELK